MHRTRCRGRALVMSVRLQTGGLGTTFYRTRNVVLQYTAGATLQKIGDGSW